MKMITTNCCKTNDLTFQSFNAVVGNLGLRAGCSDCRSDVWKHLALGILNTWKHLMTTYKVPSVL